MARREMTETEYQRLYRYKQRRDEYIREVVHSAPPLSDEQKARLAVLPAPAAEECPRNTMPGPAAQFPPRKSAQEQLRNVTERIEDPATIAQLAGLLRESGSAGVVRSGRCPDCGYLYGSSGHEVSCEGPAPGMPITFPASRPGVFRRRALVVELWPRHARPSTEALTRMQREQDRNRR